MIQIISVMNNRTIIVSLLVRKLFCIEIELLIKCVTPGLLIVGLGTYI